ncbi:hypothetical protein [Streptococcus moroccensis]|uniref:Heme/copper-type cytochrome/quinol oxidase, subunit 1 n=1 Tax=Streptococcus moroccensis TaxID=1451356 RepID=A0ABT9YPY0_9STRE|nr:hypothetical protein [Streptococcus moroccensis]MDQ0222061.1 hypothetical protein [Streptococcus moroccensis]
MSEYSRMENLYPRGKHTKRSRIRSGGSQGEWQEHDTSAPRLSLRERRAHLPWGLIIGLSGLLAVFSVANPLLMRFADSLQSQTLYIGSAMMAGHVPYMDFYGTSGLVYYLLAMAGSLLGTPWILMAIQFGLTVWSGATFYRIIWQVTYHEKISRQLLLAFYLGVACLGWGGIYASLFALPFLLNGLFFVLRYLADDTRDEGFILYGINGALVFLIDPKSSLFWLVSLVFLTIVNWRWNRKARGVYQFLATILGFLLIVYTIGYYTILYQNVGAAIEQTFLYPLTTLGLSLGTNTMPLMIGAGLLLVTGLLTSLVYGLMACISSRKKELPLLLYSSFLATLAIAILESPFSVSNLIPLVPFGVLLTGLYMAETIQTQLSDDGEPLAVTEPKSYLVLNGFLPIIAVAYIIAYPIWMWFSQESIQAERTVVAEYISQESEVTDSIYAWDNSAMVYVESDRWSSASYITPDTYLVNEDKWADLNLALGYDKAHFVVINQNQPMLDSFASHLAASYEEIDLNLDHFKLYQLK